MVTCGVLCIRGISLSAYHLPGKNIEVYLEITNLISFAFMGQDNAVYFAYKKQTNNMNFSALDTISPDRLGEAKRNFFAMQNTIVSIIISVTRKLCGQNFIEPDQALRAKYFMVLMAEEEIDLRLRRLNT